MQTIAKTKISTRTLQYDADAKTFHGYLSDLTGDDARRATIEVESARTGYVVLFDRVSSHWTPDHEGEPDGFFNYDLYRAVDGGYELKMHNCGSISTATEIPAEPWGRLLGPMVIIEENLCERALEIEWDTDLAREAHEEMEAEGRMVAAEESWAMGLSSFIDGRGNGSGRW